MKIVFIQTNSFFTWECIGVGYLGSYLKKHIPEIEIDFFTEFHDDKETIIKGCKDADIIGFTVTSPQYKGAVELSKLVKTNNNMIVFGGFHPTNVPSISVKEKSIDAIVCGEGENAILDICNGSKDIIVRKKYIDDLDTIPFIDRKLIKQERQLQHCYNKFKKRIVATNMGRGCPFGCVFCASKSVWGRKQRLRSPQHILDEILYLTKEFNIDFITFSDDEVGVNKKHLMEFCELKIKSNNKIQWGCNFVASCLDIDLVEALVSANCTEIWMGVETGNEELLKDMKKGSSLEQIRKAFKISKGKLKRRAYCILGMPNESFNTIKDTEKFLDEIKPDIVGFSILAPYPGTEFYKREYDWTLVDEYMNYITDTNFLSNEELRKEQKRLTFKYTEQLAYRNKE